MKKTLKTKTKRFVSQETREKMASAQAERWERIRKEKAKAERAAKRAAKKIVAKKAVAKRGRQVA